MEELIELILEYVEPDEKITGASSLKNDCGLSSFDMMCLTDAINEKYGSSVTFDDVRKCHTVAELAAAVGDACV